MTNSDNTYGTFNKRTTIHSQVDDGSTALVVFTSVDNAKSHIYTTNALAVWDECCTTLQWQLMADDNGDNTKLKVTWDHGTKGASDQNAADDWAEQFRSRMTTLQNADDWINNPGATEIICTDSSDHLF